MGNQLVKEQFNRQAEKFANWAVGRKVEYLKAYFDFCEIAKKDKLLDIACGPGEFTIYIAKQISEVRGVDISDKEIEIANGLAHEFGLTNVKFDCSDVEKLPYEKESFSIVVCKSAFHHFINPEKVFHEMKRCCISNGKISIQDITTYEDEYVNSYFEALDKLVDISHNRALRKDEIEQLFIQNKVKKIREYVVEVDLNVEEYVDHAFQNKKNKIEIDQLLNRGLKDPRLSAFLFRKDGGLYFKRRVYLILGKND
jgi:ubiquinone/menaquinone biosynthesis C-methylase UbiE